MGYRKKENWTLEQWIAYGNRVKRLREEVVSLFEDSQRVCGKKEANVLVSILSKIDRYKSDMEDVAAKTFPDRSITAIFYGSVLAENIPEEKGSV